MPALNGCPIIANSQTETIDHQSATGSSLPWQDQQALTDDNGRKTTEVWPQLITLRDVTGEPYLGAPLTEIPIGALSGARYVGEFLGIVVHQTWPSAVFSAYEVPRSRSETEFPEHLPMWTTREGATEDHRTGANAYQQTEGTYTVDSQLHGPIKPLWSSAHLTQKGISVRVPTRWPGLVRRSVARVLGIPPARVTIHAVLPDIDRDASLVFPAQLAAWAAIAASRLRQQVILKVTPEMMVLTGGRAPARVSWSASIDEQGSIVSNQVAVNLRVGAYPLFPEETRERIRLQATDLYREELHSLSVTAEASPTPPLGVFEGLHSSQIAFAREMHISRVAELAQEDPVHFRLSQLREDFVGVAEVCRQAAKQSDFHRRFAANELQKKRRTDLDPLAGRTRGIGFAVALQRSGFVSEDEIGSVTVRLEQEGRAVVHCSLPAPNPRLATAWRSVVADSLSVDLDNVLLNSEYGGDATDSGPAFLSRGAAVVPRAILSACAAIQKQRFRKPLPLQVRRAIRRPRGARALAEQGVAVGAAVVELEVLPATMEIEIRSVTLAVKPGQILDRLALEAEMRRGVYQALGWTLHEGVPDPQNAAELLSEGAFTTAHRGRRPRLRITIIPASTKDPPTGVGELPFSTVPAATVSALSQATGLYLDRISSTPGALLELLQAEE